MLAQSTFMASTASTLQLLESILLQTIRQLEDKSITENEIQLMVLSEVPKPVAKLQHIQKVWDGLIVIIYVTKVFSRASLKVDKARLLAGSAPHSGEWLLAPAISSVRLNLSDEAIQVSVA